MSNERLNLLVKIGYIIIAICFITLIIQGLFQNQLIKLMSIVFSILYVVGCELIKLPLYQYNKNNEKKVKKYMLLAIIPDIPLYIIMILSLNVGYGGGSFLQKTEYGLLMAIAHLILYVLQYPIIIISCLILHCIGFFMLLKVKKEK